MNGRLVDMYNPVEKNCFVQDCESTFQSSKPSKLLNVIVTLILKRKSLDREGTKS